MRKMLWGLCLAFSVFSLSAQTTYYVDAARPDDSGNGLSWATAKKSIQAAIGLAVSNDTIVVTNGIYDPISITNNLPMFIRSVNGADATLIDGGGTSRCATLGSSTAHTNTVLTGFTLCNGYVEAGNGGGSCYGTLNICILSGNMAIFGGGSFQGTLNACTLSENMASQYGGGSAYGTLNNCTLSGNTAQSGGGSYNGTLNTCTLFENTTLQYGGGSYNGTLNTCTLFENTAQSGGGSYGGTLNNCTLSGNMGNKGGGSYNGMLNNCIVWGNFVNGTTNNYSSGTFSHSCTGPLPSGGEGNIAADPLFVNAAAMNLRLGVGSPCINTGLNAGVSGTTDLDGNPRISGGQVDMGCYEFSFTNQVALVVVAVGSKVYGDVPFQLATTGGSGTGTVSYLLVSGPGTVSSSGLVTITGVGNIVVQATKAAADNYSSVTSGNLTITVNQADQTALVITSPGIKTYSNPAFQLATTGGSGTGMVSYLLISGPGTVSSSGLVTITGVGDIVVQATKAADDNYNSVTSANLSITVNKGDQTALVITSPGTKTYGDDAFQLATTGGSGTGPVSYLLISGPGTVSSSGLVTITGVGGIVLKATKAGDDNYSFATSMNLTITVNRANQMVYYVNAANPDDSGDGLSWATAKKNIQAAIGLVFSNDTIVVTNGTYAPITITDNRPILIRSVNGAEVTIIDGGGTNRCATLGSSTAHTNTVLTGFTLRDGYVKNVNRGGGSAYGTLNNCTLSGNTAAEGGGSYFGTLNTCRLSGNTATTSGGGSCWGTLNNCTLSGNTADYAGGGSAWGTLNNCMLSGNTATNSGGGSAYGTLNNCTLSGNTADWDGGGLYLVCSTNCIVWGNLANGVTNNYTGGTFSYSCTWPLPAGTGNIAADPLFVNAAEMNLRVRGDSPCINIGSNVGVSGETDLDGNPRIIGGQVDMGCYESPFTKQAALVVVAVGSKVYGDVPFQLATTGGSTTGAVSYLLVSGPGTVSASGLVTITGTGDIVVQATKVGDASYSFVTSANLTITVNRTSQTIYVDAAKPDDSGNGLSWATAKKSIQTAIELAAPSNTILVTNGIYAPISITDNRPILIRSVNGAAVTIIDGGASNRCATLGSDVSHTNTVLAGFTLRNGKANGTAVVAKGNGGGSCYGTLNTCTLSGNTATTSGGGSCWGTLNNCTLSGNSSSCGGGSCYGTLNTCTLSGNTASSHGGGSYDGTLNTCTLSGNTASVYGGGSYDGTLNNCTLSGNTASNDGGGSSDSTLNNCTLSGNTASYNGGGSYLSTLNNCTLSGNSASCGGGSCGGTLKNCTLFGNTAISYGGGSYLSNLNNCTLSGNTANTGGGSYDGALNNCIVWGNFVNGATSNYFRSTFSYSCTGPLPAGTGNIAADPLFVNAVVTNLRLRVGSPCLNTGLNAAVSGTTDLDGNLRIIGGQVDMGCYESLMTQAALVITSPGNKTYGDIPFQLTTTGGSGTGTVSYLLVSGPGTVSSSGWVTITGLGNLVVQATKVGDGNYSSVTSGNLTITVQAFYYVDVARPDDSGDGLSWATAKKSIQAAIGLVVSNDIIVVTNGIYAPISLTSNYPILIRSVNGADVTLIDGGGTNRCATLGSATAHTNTVLTGFTLRNGTNDYGGGSYGGTLNTCTFSGNTARYGGGSSYGTLNTCTLSGNTASSNGGGSYLSTLNNCTLSGNTATYSGGGSYFSTLTSCTLSGNTASNVGGGSFYGTLKNCTLFGNTASSSGGGSYYGTLNNCTLSGNTASSSGGGSYAGTLTNCIVWGNFKNGTTNNYYSGTFSYSCTGPLPSGTGNIAADPLFVNAAITNLRLRVGSPCINTGSNAGVSGETDLDGNPRISFGRVDMGCYEFLTNQVTLVVVAIGSKVYGDAPFQLATTGGSGTGTVRYLRVSGPGTVSSSGWVTITGLGNLVIQATKAADDNYSSVTSANLSIPVNRSKPTLYIIR